LKSEEGRENLKEENIRKVVREGYAKVAKTNKPCCSESIACGKDIQISEDISRRIGYTQEEIGSVPEGANMGLGCGNPVALASLKKGETVLDLGSGGGFDCFLAARRVGKDGRVIGVDMTPEMIDKARENARRGKYANVEFRLAEIENLPVADNSVDVVISNCVINLSTEKKRVFQEAYRALKPGGRLMVSDIVLSKKLPEIIRKNVSAYIGCISGAEIKNKYLQMIKDAGFREIKIIQENDFPVEDMVNDPTAKAIVKNSKIPTEEIKKIATTVTSIKVSATKPKN
jgi:SAM-dependent methyltransferase